MNIPDSLVPRPSLSLSSAVTILEAGKKELVKREEGPGGVGQDRNVM